MRMGLAADFAPGIAIRRRGGRADAVTIDDCHNDPTVDEMRWPGAMVGLWREFRHADIWPRPVAFYSQAAGVVRSTTEAVVVGKQILKSSRTNDALAVSLRLREAYVPRLPCR